MPFSLNGKIVFPRTCDIYTLGYIFVYCYHEQPGCIFGMILCIISAVVPSKNYFCMQVCVAVTPYIFGCSSMFSKISVANIS